MQIALVRLGSRSDACGGERSDKDALWRSFRSALANTLWHVPAHLHPRWCGVACEWKALIGEVRDRGTPIEPLDDVDLRMEDTAVTHACIYQHGMRAYLEGLPLSGNPYSLAFGMDAHEAWRNGWLDASRARGRLRAHEAAALRTQRQGRDSFPSQLLANGLPQSAAAQ